MDLPCRQPGSAVAARDRAGTGDAVRHRATARLLGHERVGLAAVVEDTIGVTLKKEHSAADWSTRPLPDSWLEYAALDVLHLVDVRDHIAEELHEQSKTEFAAQEFAATLAQPPRAPREDPWRRLSGLHQVKGARNLAIARSLWEAREEYAQQQDTSPGRLVPDRSLVAAVLANPQSKQALSGVQAFNGRASRTELDRWWAAMVRGRETEDLPRARVSTDSLPRHVHGRTATPKLTRASSSRALPSRPWPKSCTCRRRTC